jgi:hypothetical protein
MASASTVVFRLTEKTKKEDDMCGRMALTITISELQDILGFPVPMEYRERYNICPDNQFWPSVAQRAVISRPNI